MPPHACAHVISPHGHTKITAAAPRTRLSLQYQSGDLQIASKCLDTYFAESRRCVVRSSAVASHPPHHTARLPPSRPCGLPRLHPTCCNTALRL